MTHDFWFWAFLLVLVLLIVHVLLLSLAVKLAQTASDGWARSVALGKEWVETDRAINEWNQP